MKYAADLHLHSRYARGVSPGMTLENIALEAQLKGIDLLATGDCLHEDWVRELEDGLRDAGHGLYGLRPDMEERVWRWLPPPARRNLRFVASVEVCCSPPGTPPLGGLHHLIFFQSLESARRFRERVDGLGDLSDGRPTLLLNSRQLLEKVLNHGEETKMAPAHILNPWFSALGTVSGRCSLDDILGDLTPQIIAVETGLTATPEMCRRLSCLDTHALFSCSDAHQLQNIGRECTLLEIAPSFSALMSALKLGTQGGVLGTLKFPVERTRYFRNRCGQCRESFDGQHCPHCGRFLVTGSRDRLGKIAGRPRPIFTAVDPPYIELLPLAHLLAPFLRLGPESKAVERFCRRMIREIGPERLILTQASYEEVAAVSTPQIAKAILGQRTTRLIQSPTSEQKDDNPTANQLSLDFD